jgi:hypothetical protein
MIEGEQDRIAANVAVVQEYLHHEFPRARIELVLAPEPKRQADRVFRIHDTAAFYALNVPCEFLEDTDAAIAAYLDQWQVAALLREAGPQQVTVLKGEPPIRGD